MRNRVLLMAITACSLIAAGTAFGAGRMQPGLWRISTTLDAGQAMPQLTAEQQAQLKAAGIKLPTPGEPMISQVCVTAEQAALDTPPNLERTQSGCAAQNVKIAGNRVSADVVCTGQIKGKGHLETTYSGLTHYEGSYRFEGASQGQTQTTNSTFVANFVSANCGNVKPLQ